MVRRHDRGCFIVLCAVWMTGIATTVPAAEDWILPESALGSRTAPLLLLSRPEIRADLGLEASQVEAANQAIHDLRGRAAALRGPDSPRTIESRKQLDDAQRRWLDQHLSPDQSTRLGQIDLQWEGPSALINRPILADSLGLTPAQVQSLKASLADRNLKLADAKTHGEAEHRFAERTLATLTESQRTRWKTLLGPPLTIRSAARPRATTTR